MTISQRKTILLVEDNDDHAELVLRTFESLGETFAVRRLRDGEQALDYLLHRGAFSDASSAPRTSLALLDLRLPKVDGLEVLRQVKSTEALRGMPVVVLTTSAAEMDVAKAYYHHANAYLVKPIEFVEFNDLLRDVGLFWLVWNRGQET